MTEVTQRDPEQVRAFVEHLALVFTDWGFPRMPSRVLITLMAADEEALTAAELAERLDVSPAAISGAVRYLIHIGMLQRCRRRAPGGTATGCRSIPGTSRPRSGTAT